MMFMLLIKLSCDLHQVEGGRMAAGNFQVRGADSEETGIQQVLGQGGADTSAARPEKRTGVSGCRCVMFEV